MPRTLGVWRSRQAEAIIVVLVATIMAVWFWWPLAWRGGFIGGDTYNYFFPLRDFYQQGLLQNEFRLWHPGIGNGVPILGESQTGVFYPIYLIAYRFFDLNTAYSFVFLFHYIMASVGCYFLARTLSLNPASSAMSAFLFVYGWFPPRACLEWAIVTGAWLPIILAMQLRFLFFGGRLAWWAMAISVTMQLLAGHFNLAWITLLAAVTIAITPASFLSPMTIAIPWSRRLSAILAIMVGYLLASPQLLPAWELKTRSQRDKADFVAEIARGNVPIHYFVRSQLPWDFLIDRDQVLADMQAPSNKVEAHLYFGPLVIGLTMVGLLTGRCRERTWFWIAIAITTFLLATGIAMPGLASLPGFGFFRYCGRYGMVTQLAVAIVVGLLIDAWSTRLSWTKGLVSLFIGSAIVAEYTFVGHQVQYVTIIDPPMISLRDQSVIFRMLRPIDRVLAIDGNTLALSGAACVPPYLGMGPADYYKTWDSFPNVFPGNVPFDESIGKTLGRTGVSHLLTLAPLPASWPTTLLFSGYDPFLHPRWGREPSQPLYLYRYDRDPGRAYRVAGENRSLAEGSATVVSLEPQRVLIETDGPSACEVVLTDLLFPGWSVTVDGVAAESIALPAGRAVQVEQGKHRIEWRFRSIPLLQGRTIAIITIFVAMLVTGIPWRRVGRD
ncbi:hypothetical protein K2X85_01685 [bacterium]|nr:hypothetical protein [bacterium]